MTEAVWSLRGMINRHLPANGIYIKKEKATHSGRFFYVKQWSIVFPYVFKEAPAKSDYSHQNIQYNHICILLCYINAGGVDFSQGVGNPRFKMRKSAFKVRNYTLPSDTSEAVFVGESLSLLGCGGSLFLTEGIEDDDEINLARIYKPVDRRLYIRAGVAL